MEIIYDTWKGEELDADKRFICFGFCQYYPGGGLADTDASYDDIESAMRHVKNDSNEYKYIYDRIAGKTIDLDVMEDEKK